MLAQQEVIQFLKAALECSIYVCPGDPGLSYYELVQAAKSADFFEGEIRDAIPQATTLYWGAGDAKILLDKDDLTSLSIFGFPEEPDYRNPVAFHRVFEEMRLLVRQEGIANAQIERMALVEACISKQAPEYDVQVAIAILTLNDILEAKNGIIRFARGKETFGSPGDQTMRLEMHDGRRFPRPARARAYPIVKRIIEARDQPAPIVLSGDATQSATEKPLQLTNDEWISASKALDMLGHKSGSAPAICKRAHAGLVKTRAKLFLRGGKSFVDATVPREFWWAGGQAALKQNWNTGDFETWIDRRIQLQAFGVEFLCADIESMTVVNGEGQKLQRTNVFIGHGRSHLWMHLQNFLQARLHLAVDEFNVEPTAGVTTKERLEEMLNEATFAFLVMTAEDEQPDGTTRARENVIHEVGLFQGRLGFRKAVVMLENGCNEFSNIAGIGEIRFNKDDIQSKFEEVRRTLERENIIRAQ